MTASDPIAVQPIAPVSPVAGAAEAPPVRRALPGELLVVNTVVGLARWMSPSLARTARVEKRSDAWPFEPFLERVRIDPRRLAPEAEIDRVEARARDVRRRLRGVVRQTSYGKGVARAAAAGVCQRVSSPRTGMALLYALVEIYKPRWVVELGSAFGVGSTALTLALASGGREDARFDGVEFEEWRAKIADSGVREILGDRARVHPGDIAKALPRLAREAGLGPGVGPGAGPGAGERVGMAFVDAEHTFDATLGYHRALLPLLEPGAIVVYDDTEWSDEMRRAWKAIVADARVTDALSLGKRWGVIRVS